MKTIQHLELRKRKRGFSLVELMVAMAITMIVMGAALMMFVKATDTNDMTSQMTEMQANARVAANLISSDLSQAGTGLPWGGISLPSQGGAAAEVFATDSSGAAYLVPNNFYNNPGTGANSMYGVTPDYRGGPTIGGQPMDGINMVYADPLLSISNPAISNWPQSHPTAMSSAGATTTITMPGTLVPPMNDPNAGVKVGDIMMVSNGTGQAVGTVTNVAANAMTLAPGDPFVLNQSATGMAGTIPSLGTIDVNGNATYIPGNITVMRLYVISYFLEPLDGNNNRLALPGAGAVDYRLMRQINSLPPTIVAEHIDFFQFSYDLADPSCPSTANLSHIPDAVEPACGTSPAAPAYDRIRTVYLSLAARVPRPDRRGQYAHVTVNSAIGPRSLSYNNTYPPPPS